MEIEKRYNPEASREKWYQFWLEHDLFKADPESPKPKYSIVIPPQTSPAAPHRTCSEQHPAGYPSRWKRMEGFERVDAGNRSCRYRYAECGQQEILKNEGRTRHDLGVKS